MKILFSLLAFCLFASCVHSQEAVDTVSVRVQYRVKYNERNMKLLPICIHYAIYSFISKRTNSEKERPL